MATKDARESFAADYNERFKDKIFLSLDDLISMLDFKNPADAERTIRNWIKRKNPKRRPPRIYAGSEVKFPRRDFIHWLQEEIVRR